MQIFEDEQERLRLTSAVTIEAWVKPEALGTSWRTIALKEHTGDLAYALYATNGNARVATQFPTYNN